MLDTLLLMRHAKSSWSDMSLSDHDRPLNARGRAAADAVGTALVVRGFAPDMIWASDSQRTKETAKRLIRVIPGAQTVLHIPQFYHASVEDVLSVLGRSEVPDVSSLMLLGHNPGWSDLNAYFNPELALSMGRFPTGACAVFKRAVKKSEPWFDPKNWRPLDVILPRELDV